MSLVERIFKNILGALPDNGRFVKTSVRSLLVRKELAIGKLALRFAGVTLPDPRTVYLIDPARIEYATCSDNRMPDWEDWVLPQKGNINQKQAGQWDVLRHKFSETRIYRAVEARIRHHASWQSTDYYLYALQQIDAGRKLWGCANRADFDIHCASVDQLIQSILVDGYRDSVSLSNQARMDSALGQSEVIINISRDGLPLFQDGRHRLAIARVLGIPQIPVQVLVRHADWVAFREFLLRVARSAGGTSRAGVLYQRAAHFDLLDIPAEHGCEDRWAAIAPHVPAAQGRALDIGCNLGFVCHRLEELGYSTLGIEYLPDIAYAARRIAKAECRAFKVITGDILDETTLTNANGLHYAVVMALNIFHHFIKTERGYQRLRTLMGRLDIETMYFEPHQPDDPQMQGAFFNPAPDEFAELVRSWGHFKSASAIYLASDGRPVYKLTR